MRPSTLLGLLALSLLAAACACQPACDSNGNADVVATKYVHKYGVTMPQYQWEESGQNGQIVTTTHDGVCCSKTYYCGVLEGDTTHSFPFSNSIEKVQTYSQSQLMKEVTHYPSGQIRTETIHNPPEPTTVREWYENGTLKLLEKYAGSQLSYGEYYDAKGERTSGIESGSGLKAMRDTYGALWGVEEVKGGELIYRTTYYPNGSPKEIDPYKDGVLTGLRKTYYQGGEPQTIETWIDGKQEGITTVFKDGEKVQEIPYKNGLKNGIGRLYRDGAIVVQEITWKDDRMHGPSRTYIEDRVATEWYFKGNKVTKGYYDSFQIKPFKETPSVEHGALETAHLPSVDTPPDAAYPNRSPAAR